MVSQVSFLTGFFFHNKMQEDAENHDCLPYLKGTWHRERELLISTLIIWSFLYIDSEACLFVYNKLEKEIG